MNIRRTSTLIIAFSSLSAAALAQTPQGLRAAKPVSEGKTEVSKEGFEAPTGKPAAEAERVDTQLTLSAGSLVASGNARLLALTSAAAFRARRDDNQVVLNFAGNYSRSAANKDAPVSTTVENLQGKARYDRFISSGFAVFTALQGRRDRFQGLDLRLNLDPGVSYYLIDREKHALWAELGYDLQLDVRRNENLVEARLAGTPLASTETRHNGRGFLGYQNELRANVTFNTGLELIQAFKDPALYRVNWDIALATQVAESLAVSANFVVRYDNVPLPNVQKTDTITSVNLVYRAL